MDQNQHEDLRKLSQRALSRLLLHHTHEGTLKRLTTDGRDHFRIGHDSTSPQDDDLNARISSALAILQNNGLIPPRGEHPTLMQTGNNAFDIHLPNTPIDAAPILDLLLRTGLTPYLMRQSINTLKRSDRDDTLDAIDHGALPMVQLAWEWAGTRGDVRITSQGSQRIDMAAFYNHLARINTDFPLEISAPAHPKYHRGLQLLSPWLTQRVHLINRTDWIPWPQGSLSDEVTTTDFPDDLPDLTDPGLHLNRERIGETWLRIQPAHLAAFKKQDPLEALQLLRSIAVARTAALRYTVAEQFPTYNASERNKAAEIVSGVTRWQTILEQIITILENVAPEQRTLAAPGIFTIMATGKPPTDGRSTPLDTITTFLTELDEITETERTQEVKAHAQLRRWHQRATSWLRTHHGDAEANAFLAIDDSDWITPGPSLDRTLQYRAHLTTLQDELRNHRLASPEAQPSQAQQPTQSPKEEMEGKPIESMNPWTDKHWYALLSMVTLIIALLAASALLRSAHAPVDAFSAQAYYVVLVILGLSAAAFLFGALRSYARYTGKAVAGTLELGGPVVVAALLVIGGYALAPMREVFNVVVRIHDPQSEGVSGANVTLYLDQDTRVQPTNSNGEAQFNAVPVKFRSTPTSILVRSEAYESNRAQYPLVDVVEITVRPRPKRQLLTEDSSPLNAFRTRQELDAAAVSRGLRTHIIGEGVAVTAYPDVLTIRYLGQQTDGLDGQPRVAISSGQSVEVAFSNNDVYAVGIAFHQGLYPTHFIAETGNNTATTDGQRYLPDADFIGFAAKEPLTRVIIQTQASGSFTLQNLYFLSTHSYAPQL